MNELTNSTSLANPPKSPAEQQMRKKKIMDIRRQLARGKYNINKRLNVVLDRILEDIIHIKK